MFEVLVLFVVCRDALLVVCSLLCVVVRCLLFVVCCSLLIVCCTRFGANGCLLLSAGCC